MMNFVQYLEAMQASMPSPLWLTQATAASLASPGKEETLRAIERATKRGRAVSVDDLRACISPEAVEKAQQGGMKLAAAQLSRGSGSMPGPGGFAGGPSRV